MRIAFIHSYYSSADPSGENIAVELQAQALRRAGHDVEIIAAHTDELVTRRGYRVRTAASVAMGRGLDPTPRLRAFHPDVVHLHNLFPNFGTSWLGKHPGPVVATAHNFRYVCSNGMLARDGVDCTDCLGSTVPLPALRHRCYRGSLAATLPVAASLIGGPQRQPVLRAAKRIIVLSPRARRVFSAAGVAAHRLVVIPNFIESSGITPPEAPSAGWIFVGRLSEQKGIVPLLRDWPPGVPLDIFGDGELRQEVAALAKGAVRFRGSASRQELLAALPGRLGLIFCSRSAEGLPTVYLEALAHGVPVVARKGNSAADDVIAAGTGAVYTTSAELRDALTHVEAEWALLSQRALERFATKYSVHSWLRDVTRLYAQVS